MDAPRFTIYVDADACPARDEVLWVCRRHALIPVFVANAPILAIANSSYAKMEVVTGDFDAADNWIVEQAVTGDLVLTSDLLLAQRAVKKVISALNFSGQQFTENLIHDLVAQRGVQQLLREMSLPSHRPATYGKQDRSHFKDALHRWIEARKRQG